jgi:uncharacterized protein with von Willebrand factor type A (vWA) domain
VSLEILEKVLRRRTFKERLDEAKEAVKSPEMEKVMAAIAKKIKDYVEDYSKNASKKCNDAFASLLRSSSAWPRSVVQLAKIYYDNYQGYDFVMYRSSRHQRRG